MKIETLSLGQLQTNCYIVYCGKEAVIIDPADEAEFIAEKINRLNLEPLAIFATHGHFDHILAAGELQAIFNIPFYINSADEFLVKKMAESARFWLKRKIDNLPPRNAEFFKNDFSFDFDGCRLKIIETPGHTPGSICLKTDNIIFTGDTLFKDGVGRSDFAYSDKDLLKKSLGKIFRLPPKTIIYSGHGEKTTVGGEKIIT